MLAGFSLGVEFALATMPSSSMPGPDAYFLGNREANSATSKETSNIPKYCESVCFF